MNKYIQLATCLEFMINHWIKGLTLFKVSYWFLEQWPLPFSFLVMLTLNKHFQFYSFNARGREGVVSTNIPQIYAHYVDTIYHIPKRVF